MPRIKFPNVPILSGVPALARVSKGVNFPKFFTGILTGVLWGLLQNESKWGVFDSNGKPIGEPNNFKGLFGSIISTLGGSSLSTLKFDFHKETKVSEFPIEGGGFASYNKVELPANPVVTLVLSGSESDRSSFIDAIDKACKSLDLYSVVTPEVTYINYSIESYNYSRSNSNGSGMMIVELSLREIRQVTVAYGYAEIAKEAGIASKDIGASNQIDSGKVQPTQIESSTLKKSVGGVIDLFGKLK